MIKPAPTSDSLVSQALAVYERAKQHNDHRESAKIYQLPIWPEPDRGVPNEILRSALFAAIQAKGQIYFRNQEIASQAGCRISYTGNRLTQAHLDVFEGIMHIGRGAHEGNRISFSAHRLLKLIGRSTGGDQHKWLYGIIQELTATSVAIEQDRKRVFWGSLLPEGAAEVGEGAYVVEISRNLIKLFERGFTQIDWEQRRKLRRKPLAQWLQLYYSSHAKPHPVSVGFVHDKSGSATVLLKKFRQNLRAALREIQRVGVISEWRIDAKTDLLHVVRNPSPSQLKHLSRTEGDHQG